MTRARTARQIEGILEGNGLRWARREDKFTLRFDSALVTMTLADWGMQTIIQLRSCVLADAEAATDAVLAEVNRLNCETTFGKWAYYSDERVLSLEYDLLADHLQEAELMTALAVIARLADQQDDLLRVRLGGRRAVD